LTIVLIVFTIGCFAQKQRNNVVGIEFKFLNAIVAQGDNINYGLRGIRKKTPTFDFYIHPKFDFHLYATAFTFSGASGNAYEESFDQLFADLGAGLSIFRSKKRFIIGMNYLTTAELDNSIDLLGLEERSTYSGLFFKYKWDFFQRTSIGFTTTYNFYDITKREDINYFTFDIDFSIRPFYKDLN